jgi:polyhydroxybutyrate depolymerase
VEAVPIMFIHGTLDVSVPWDGQSQDTGTGPAVPISLSVPETIGFWVDLNNCGTVADYEEIPQSGDSPGTRVFVNRFGDCENDNPPVVFYLVEGGGHNWPGRPGIIGDEIAGMVNVDINASDVIWDFFSRYTLGDTE